jgi:uroporphyrinogen-III synthase
MPFSDLRVLSLETRRAEQMTQLIERFGGKPFVAPSVQEIPFSQNEEVFVWAERLLAGEFELIVLMTGVGLTYLRDAIVERHTQEAFVEALRRMTIVSRGPKPVAVLHELGLKCTIMVPEPNTWIEIAPLLKARPERRITIQEYGRENPEFVKALEAFGAEVTPISIYRWMLPDDLEPLREAVRRIAASECDVVIYLYDIDTVGPSARSSRADGTCGRRPPRASGGPRRRLRGSHHERSSGAGRHRAQHCARASEDVEPCENRRRYGCERTGQEAAHSRRVTPTGHTA